MSYRRRTLGPQKNVSKNKRAKDNYYGKIKAANPLSPFSSTSSSSSSSEEDSGDEIDYTTRRVSIPDMMSGSVFWANPGAPRFFALSPIIEDYAGERAAEASYDHRNRNSPAKGNNAVAHLRLQKSLRNLKIMTASPSPSGGGSSYSDDSFASGGGEDSLANAFEDDGRVKQRKKRISNATTLKFVGEDQRSRSGSSSSSSSGDGNSIASRGKATSPGRRRGGRGSRGGISGRGGGGRQRRRRGQKASTILRLHFHRNISQLFREMNGGKNRSRAKGGSKGGGGGRNEGEVVGINRISRNAITVLDTIVKDLIARFAAECDRLLIDSRFVSLGAEQAIAAVRLLFPPILPEFEKRYQELSASQFRSTRSRGRGRRRATKTTKMKGKTKSRYSNAESSPIAGPSSAANR